MTKKRGANGREMTEGKAKKGLRIRNTRRDRESGGGGGARAVFKRVGAHAASRSMKIRGYDSGGRKREVGAAKG